MAESVADQTLQALAGSSEGPDPSGAYNDAALLAGLRAGDDSAYEALILHYQHPVYGLVTRLLSDPTEAADVTQEVFLKIFRNISSFREHSSLRTWIYRIAVNEAYNHRRWFSRHHGQEVAPNRDDDARDRSPVLQDTAPNAFDLVSDRETRALIEKALSCLNPNFRAAVVLRDIEELSYEEIASILDVSLGTVKSRILRGREALRRVLTTGLDAEPRTQWAPGAIGFAKSNE